MPETNTPTTVIDLHDRLDDLREQLNAARARRDDLEAKSERLTVVDEADDTADDPDTITRQEATDLEADYAEACEDIREWRFAIARIERSIAEWEGHSLPNRADRSLDELDSALEEIPVEDLNAEFRIQQLAYGARNRVNDKLRTRTVNSGGDDPRTKVGAYDLMMIEEALVETPSGAPSDPKQLDAPVGSWLAEKVNAYNSRGETTARDFSLWE
ncbi:hypothetical protein Hbl1158_10170 [Halobaculum sp. CBA1158]|uniref:hypothetical protein n=1 Tax=Halobaculum sp. CBA1158 TaxID=2904243 RepID=UPI001F40E2FF|nr:hypothetical protein [Halobaculum sp. CBA1158]UIO98899.1 hypothetical protein Hbl1158_10170 [Halobaculum sp. CBA1158]